MRATVSANGSTSTPNAVAAMASSGENCNAQERDVAANSKGGSPHQPNKHSMHKLLPISRTLVFR